MKLEIYPIKLEKHNIIESTVRILFQFSLFPISIVIVPIPFVSINYRYVRIIKNERRKPAAGF